MKNDSYIKAIIEEQNREELEDIKKENIKLKEKLRYPKPAVTATVIVKDLTTDKYLIIKRGNNPYKDCYAFPGGFLNANEESIEETAVREIREETNIKIEKKDLSIIDIRSNPKRDPRDHVIDVGFYVELYHAIEQSTPGDDAKEICWVEEEVINKEELAFDHQEFWKNFKNSKKYVFDE